MLETKCVDDKYKMLVKVLAILVTIFLRYRRAPTFTNNHTNVHKHSQIVNMLINITVTELAFITNFTVSMIMSHNL